jgi:starch synthase
LLQIEERQKLYSSSNAEQPPASAEVEQPSEPHTQPTVEIAEASTSSQAAPSSSGRPLAAAWPSPPPSKRTARSVRAAVQPYSPPATERPVAAPEAESKRDFHSDHSREGTGGNASQPAPQQPETNAAAPSAAEKPPPLAGPNVMNVILVAAECAPWSKTGQSLLLGLHDKFLLHLLVSFLEGH